MRKMNKKGLVWFVPIIVVMLLVPVVYGAIKFIDFKYFKTIGGERVLKPSGTSPVFGCVGLEGNPVPCVVSSSDTPVPDWEKVTTWCEKNYEQWGFIPFVRVRDENNVFCIKCTDFLNNANKYSLVVLSTEVDRDIPKFVSKDSCLSKVCGSSEQKDGKCSLWSKEQPVCPKKEVFGVPLIPDVVCQLKEWLKELFRPLIIITSVLVGLMIFGLTYTYISKAKKKQRNMILVIGLIIAIGIGLLFYYYFWYGLIAMIIAMIVRGFLPRL